MSKESDQRGEGVSVTLHLSRLLRAVSLAALLSPAISLAAERHDQGHIFSTGDILQVTRGTFSQTITAGQSGQLTRIEVQWNAAIPAPAPNLFLSIESGGNPGGGDTLYTETIDPTGEYDNGIFSWDLRDARLFFEAGEQFTFNFGADALGLVIAANDPPGYPGGALYLDGELLPESWVNDIAFITYVDPDAVKGPVEYEVRLTNLTAGQTFAPQLFMTHAQDFYLYRLAKPASEGLASLAEGGATAGLVTEAGEFVVASAVADAPLGPGQSMSITISGKPGLDMISMAAMMQPTNDSFVALHRLRLPARGIVMRTLRAYDAGTEDNDESCAHIPGAFCGGEGPSVEDGEGFVHISDGVHGIGGLDTDGFTLLDGRDHDWRNPVARITVKRVE